MEIRLLAPEDDLAALTSLLHRAYRRLGDEGFRFMATHQSVEDTKERVDGGECYVVENDGRIVSTLTFYDVNHTRGCEWYDRNDVASFGQFGVEPELQGRGIGTKLIEIAERRAVETGARELALDTAEGALRLIAYYKRLGYRHVGYADWQETNYRSVILSKDLRTVSGKWA